MNIEVKLLHSLNALLHIWVTLFGKDIDCKLVHFQKAPSFSDIGQTTTAIKGRVVD